MRRIVIGVLAIVLLAVGVYLGGPYYTLWRLVQAARAHDTKVVAQIVDFPSVRASLKPQLTAALQAQLERQKPKPSNLLEQIGAAIAPVFVGNAVDTVITPEGVAVMLRTGHAPNPTSPFAKTPAPAFEDSGVGDPKLVDMGYNGVLFDGAHKRYVDFDLDQFHASVISRSHPEARINVVMLRRGILEWKVEALDIPALSNGA
jgi:hypothetical protein